MLNSLRDAETYLNGLVNLERRADFDYEALGLARIRALLRALDDPQAGLPCVHVAGSKGKGSVALATECLLRAAGQRVGTFTSPHLSSWLERYRIDAADAAPEQLLHSLRRAQPAIEKLRADERLCPSFFDAATALALEMFREQRVDAAVVEVGLGGRLDSTNAVESRVSVITSIQLEHVDKLGSTHAAIAREKAGILRRGVPLVCGPLGPDARRVVRARAGALAAPLVEVAAPEVALDEAGLSARLADGRRLRASLLGAHQGVNLALAVAAAEHYLDRSLGPGELGALEELRLPARLEQLGDVILDSAHTPDSARALREALTEVWPGRRWVLGLCVSRDKDAPAILRELAPLARACVASAAEPLRSMDPIQLAGLARDAGIPRVECVPEPLTALARVRELATAADLRVLTGSVYFAGAVRGQLLAEAAAGG